ncbi:MAG: hypothetical protein FP831_16485 [Anaerolineae bacterium]|nr:hypothetical protein [Anaerolineae bacterium]
MKPISEMSQIEVAAFVQSNLETRKIHVTLSGGAATSFYSQNQYVSADIDLVNEYSVTRKRIDEVMNEIGFSETGRYFIHPESEYVVEFPPGPLTVGVEPVKVVEKFELETGILQIISATDCIKDRLAAFYHWGDEQCLYQARLVKKVTTVDLKEIERWSKNEGKEKEFILFVSKE